jgi:indolepyruvate ferredoxin oxidoreductase alpha subunit
VEVIVRRAFRVLAVPGHPVTHCCELLAAAHSGYEFSINEAVAMSVAVGLSAAGATSAVIVKQVGLGVAADALANAVGHSVGAGLVIFVGDDVGATKSTVDLDSRAVLRALDVPVVDLGAGPHIAETVNAAFDASEAAGAPVAVRFTAGLHTYRRPAPAGRSRPGAPIGLDRRIRKEVAFDLSKKGRQEHLYANAIPLIADRLQAIDRWGSAPHGATDSHTGVIASGDTWTVAPPGVCLITAGSVWPVTSTVTEFCRAHAEVVVLEDTKGVLENELRSTCLRMGIDCSVKGRESGHLPALSGLGPLDVSKALTTTSPTDRRQHIVPTVKRRAADDHVVSHELFQALKELAADGVFVACDIGSACRACYPPYDAGEVALSLGSPIAVAGGAARTGRSAIAVIGDYAVFHSGLQTLIDTVNRDIGLAVVVLMNGISAQTGGQPLCDDQAALGRSLSGLHDLAGAIGVDVQRMPARSLASDHRNALEQILASARPVLLLCEAGV